MIIVKIGGASGILHKELAKDIAARNDRMVLVHGGSAMLDEVSARLGKQPLMVTSASGYVSRRTDKETMDMFMMVYCGLMNKRLVEELQKHGVDAVGLSGLDGRLLQGRKKNLIIVQDGIKKVLRDDYTGTIEEVNSGLLELLIQAGLLPVVAPPALSRDREAINVDGDRAAARIAAALHAEALVILSNIPGLLRDVGDEGSVIPRIPKEKLDDFMAIAQGRMKKKLMGAREALDAGVPRVVIGDARIESPLSSALQGKGTVIS